MSKSLLRQFIREQAGVGRNAHTLDDSPNTFEDFDDYNVEISPNVNGAFTLTIYFKGKKMDASRDFNDYEEAHHHARMIVDNHRVTNMQTDG